MTPSTSDKIDLLSKRVARHYKADIYALVGPLNDRARDKISALTARPKRKRALLTVVTDGGILSSAYQIGRLLQECYDDVSIFIPSYCKSAGTLLAIAGNQIIMSAGSELGPIDTQIALPGEHKFHSALCSRSAIRAINENVREAYFDGMKSLIDCTEGRFTPEQAVEFSANLVTTAFSGLISKIDPITYGASERALNESIDYAARLAAFSQNIDAEGIVSLVGEYASHDFVIDRLEAGTIFKNVLKPNSTLQELGEIYAEIASSNRRKSELESSPFPSAAIIPTKHALQGRDLTHV